MTKEQPMIDQRVRHVIVFKNGNVTVCDADGQHIPEYQGNIRLDPTLIGRVRAACGPGVEWIGTERLTLLSSPLVDWMPPPPPGHSTQEQRDAWRKIVDAPHWEAPEMEAASVAIAKLLAEVELLHTELRVARFDRDEISKRGSVTAVGHGATLLEHKATTEKLEKIIAAVLAERNQLASDLDDKHSFVEQLLDGLAQHLPPKTPRTVAAIVAAVRQLRDVVDGDCTTAAIEKNARISAAFQKLLQIGDVVAAKIGVSNDGPVPKLNPGRVIVECERCYLRYETPQVSPRLASQDDSFPCPHCSDTHVGVGRSFDDACADALRRLAQRSDTAIESALGEPDRARVGGAWIVETRGRVWIVGSHRVYVAKVGVHVMVVHMVRLSSEREAA